MSEIDTAATRLDENWNPPEPTDGGPAFPVSIPGCGDNGQSGMSSRHWSAGQALAGMLCNGFVPNQVHGGPYVHQSEPFDYAGAAYFIADAMLAQRGRK